MERILDPDYASVESWFGYTPATPDLQISIVRLEQQSKAETASEIRDAVEFVEAVMGLPLPTDHVILVLKDKAVTEDFAGTNYGFAISYKTEYEDWADSTGWRQGLVHETAHYYWRGNEDWIDEGIANTYEYLYGLEVGLSPGLLAPRRGGCDAHNLEMVEEWAPTQDDPQFTCNYYLGERLFRELYDRLGHWDGD